MKQFYVILFMLCSRAAFSQNTFPPSGNVGIGTLSPTANLTVAGSGNASPNNGPAEVDYFGLNLTFKGESGGSGFNLGSIKMVQPVSYFIDAADMVLSTGRSGLSEKMRITQFGNVGIGTANPSAILHIKSLGSSTDLYTQQMIIESSATYNNSPIASILFRNNYNSGGTTAGMGQIAVGKSNPTDGDLSSFMAFSTRSAGGNVTDRMIIDANGNVGIGTDSPTSKLRVTSGGVTVGNNVINNNTDGALSIGNTQMSYSPTSDNWYTTGSTLMLNAEDYSTIAFHHSGSRVDFIRSGAGTIQIGYDGGWGRANVGLPNGVWNAGGNVGIGTMSPREALSVNGSIRSKQVTVDINNWPDYVFKSGYTLPDLALVKHFIDQHHHLPDIPGAAEVEKEGLNLGEMNKLLTRKVEELTLYLIEKDKQLGEQKQINESQERKLESIEKQLKVINQKLN